MSTKASASSPPPIQSKQENLGGVGYNSKQINHILYKNQKTILFPFAESKDKQPSPQPSEENSTDLWGWLGLKKIAWWENLGPVPVTRIDKNEVSSNEVMEDTHSENRFGGTLIVGVYDGHGGGNECSDALSTYLSSYIAHSLSILPPPAVTNDSATISPDRVKIVTKALQSAFVRLDADLLSGRIDLPVSEEEPPLDVAIAASKGTNNTNELTKREKWISRKLLSATRGSCAIVTYIEGNDVFVACTGDSRAVLGRRINGDGVEGWRCIELSVDQTLKNAKEYERILNEHPGEDQSAISRGRILGSLMPTRAFGDARFKWPSHILSSLEVLNPRRIKPYRYLTPPYVTAEPVVTHHRLDLNRDLFMIVACDGIWDALTSEEAVDLVGGFLETQKMIPPPIYQTKQASVSSGSDSWAFKDANAATHLIRNALGGSDEHVGKLLAIPPPYSRRYRDDMTATVIFFSGVQTGSGGNVTEKDYGTEDELQEVDLKRADLKRDRLKEWCRELEKKKALKARL